MGACSLRLIFLFQIEGTPLFSNLFSDSQIYHTLSGDILSGAARAHAFFMSPMYPYLIAWTNQILGHEFFWVRFIQCILGSVSVVLVFEIGRKVFDKTSGLIAACIAAVYPLFIFYDNMILIESVQTFFVTAHILFLMRALDKKNWWYWVGAGCTGGLMLVGRASIIIFFIVFVIYASLSLRKTIQHLWRGSLFMSSGCALIILPWVVMNYSTEREIVPITGSAGFNFFAGNNEQATGEYTMRSEIDILNDPNGHRYVEKQLGKKLGSNDVSSYWFDQSWRWISNHAGDYFLLQGKKILLFFNAQELDQLGLSYDFFQQEYKTLLNFPLPNFLLVSILAGAGFVFHVRTKSKRVVAGIILLFIASYIISIVLFFVSGRLRVPVTPLIILFSGYGLVESVRAFKSHQWRDVSFAAIGSCIMVLLATVLNVRIPVSFSEEYNRLGMVMFDEKKFDAAQSYYIKSLRYGENVRIRLNLANAYAAAGMVAEADRAYRIVIESSPHNALAYYNFGNFALQVNKPKQAYLLWSRAIKEDSSCAPAYRNLAVLLSQAGKYREAIEKFEQYLRYEKGQGQASMAKQDIANLRELIETQQ